MSATLYHGTMECQSIITLRARCKQATVKHYWRIDVRWEKGLFIREHVASLLFVTIGILLTRTKRYEKTPPSVLKHNFSPSLNTPLSASIRE